MVTFNFSFLLENLMRFNKWSSASAEPLMLKQTVSNFHANPFLWTPLTKAAVLFIYPSIFHHGLGIKTGASKSCQFPRLSHWFSILYFCYFRLQKGKKKRTFISCRSVLESSSVSLAEVSVIFFPFLRPCGKPWYQYVEAITGKRDAVMLLDGDTASYVRNPDDKYSRHYRAEDYHYCSSSRPFSILLCFHFLSSSRCQLEKTSSKMGKCATQPWVLVLHPLHIVIGMQSLDGINRNNNHSADALNDSEFTVDNLISGEEAKVKEWIRQQGETLMLFLEYQQVGECMLINAQAVLGSAWLP